MISPTSLMSPPRPALRQLGFGRDVTQRLTFIAIALVLINLITMRYRVEGPSMQPTLDSGEVLVVNRLLYKLVPPTRGDIVVFHLPLLSRDDLIKRVVGLPRETVEIRNHQVWINGNALETPWGLDCADCEAGIWLLEPKEYFLLGDQRAISRDSRTFGPVPEAALVGKVFWRYWPLSAFGPIG